MQSSRERLKLTLNHRQPEKVVVDMGSTAITGINANALSKLRDVLGLEKRKIKICEPLQLLGLVEEDVREALAIDVVDVTNNYTMFGFENANWKSWTLPSGLEVEVPGGFMTTRDANGRTYLYPQGDVNAHPSAELPVGGHYFDNIVRNDPGFDEDDADGRRDFKDDFAVFTDEQLRVIEKRCKDIYENSDYAMIGGGALAGIGDVALLPGPSVKNPKGIRDVVEWLVAHHTMPRYIHDIYAMQTEIGIKNAEMFYQACGNKLQAMIVSGTDFGTQRGPYISPDFYREFYKPYHAKINAWIHTHTEWRTFYHTCGSISEFFPDFVEAGVDIVNPVQISAEGMDPRYLKAAWGDKLVFWGGGSDTQKTLQFRTPEQVYAETASLLEVFAPGGGYVFNTVHNIQPTTPPENIVAMFNAIRDFNQKGT